MIKLLSMFVRYAQLPEKEFSKLAASELFKLAEMAESKLKDLRFSPSHGWSVLHEQPSDHEEGSTLATATSYAASELSRHPDTDSSFGSCS